MWHYNADLLSFLSNTLKSHRAERNSQWSLLFLLYKHYYSHSLFKMPIKGQYINISVIKCFIFLVIHIPFSFLGNIIWLLFPQNLDCYCSIIHISVEIAQNFELCAWIFPVSLLKPCPMQLLSVKDKEFLLTGSFCDPLSLPRTLWITTGLKLFTGA